MFLLRKRCFYYHSWLRALAFRTFGTTYTSFGLSSRSVYNGAMQYQRPEGVLAGFHADIPEPQVPELVHIGEQWAARTYRIPPHIHACWEFYLQVSGTSRWSDAYHAEFTLLPGGFLAMPPGLRHTLRDVSPLRHHFYFAAIDLSLLQGRLPEIACLWHGTRAVFAENGGSLIQPFRQLVREVSLHLPQRPLGTRAALDVLLVEASRLVQGAERKPHLQMHPAILYARNLLDTHPAMPWLLSDLAHRVGLSPQHLAERFQQEVGLPPHQYLLQQRIVWAQEMLERGDLSMAEVGLEVGFGSSQHFATVFKRLTGLTPREYRRVKNEG